MIKNIQDRFITIIIFLLGFSLCVSTSLMSITYPIVSCLAFVQKDFSLKEVFKNKFILASVLFYCIFIFATLWSKVPFVDRWKMLTHIVIYLVAPLLFMVLKNQNHAKKLLEGFVIGALLSAILSILSVLFHHPILYGLRDPIKGSVFHGHILHNAFLAIAASIFLAIILNKNTLYKNKIYACIAYLICIIDIFFIVDGRTGMIMLLVMNGFMVLCFLRRKGLIILAVTAVAAAPLFYLSPAIKGGIKNYQADMNNYKMGNIKTSMGYRLVFHEVSNKLILQNPLLGSGTGSFAASFKDYVTKHHIPAITVNPHRDILWVGVETGICGMILFLIMLFAAVYESLKLTYFDRIIGLSLILGYFTASLQNSFFIDNVTGIAFVVIFLSIMGMNNEV